jgi:hypothetical protein
VKNKQGAELSLNVVIVAVIVLLVAIVLIYLFTQGIGPFATFSKSCEEQGGFCSPTRCSELNPPARSMPYHDWCQEHTSQEYCCYSGGP